MYLYISISSFFFLINLRCFFVSKVQISLVADGWGNASMALPPTVDVLFEGKRVTVALPAGEIRVKRGCTCSHRVLCVKYDYNIELSQCRSSAI